MSRPLLRWAAILQIGLVLFTGCHPTQPFFVQRDESLSNYIAQSMDIEYADVHIDSLPEATHAMVPLGPDHLPTEFVDLTLEDCVSLALQNTKILRVVNGSNRQSGSVSPALLSAAPGQMPSIFDPAVTSTTGNSQPLTIDSQGNRVAPRGSIRANQVGGVEDALSEFDAQFSALFGYNTTDRPRNVGPGNVFNPQFFQAVDANGQAALSKRMAGGTIATARFTTVYSRNNIPSPGLGRNVPSDYTAALELQVTQPLLRGRGALVNRIPVVLARINEEIQLHEFEANIRNLVKSVEDAYWDLYCGYRALESSKVAHKTATDLWRVANARTQIGDTPPEAEAQSRALYAQFKQQVHSALYGSTVTNEPGLYGREQLLREKIGWSATDGKMLRPIDKPTFARVHFDWEEVKAEAFTRSVELRRQQWAIKQRELELISAKNQILPQLDVTGFYRWLGVGDHFARADRTGITFPNAGSTALEELTGGDYQEVGARLEFTPNAIGKRRTLNNIKNGQFLLKKFQEELREKEMALSQELSSAWRTMHATFIAITDSEEQVIANQDEIRIYNDKISGNVGELNQLLDNLLRAEERRSRSELLYFQAVCEYNKSLVNIHYLKGSLLDLNNIQLQEGPWVEKAYWDAEERARERAGGIYFDYGYTRPAVVSNGPVESGGVTEGNVSNPGFTYERSETDGPEEVPAEETEGEGVEGEDGQQEGSDPGELQPLPKRPLTAGVAPSGLRSTTNAAVRTASASGFQWGDLGLNGQTPTTKPTPSGRGYQQSISDSDSGRPVQVISSGGTRNNLRVNSSSAGQWTPR